MWLIYDETSFLSIIQVLAIFSTTGVKLSFNTCLIVHIDIYVYHTDDLINVTVRIVLHFAVNVNYWLCCKLYCVSSYTVCVFWRINTIIHRLQIYQTVLRSKEFKPPLHYFKVCRWTRPCAMYNLLCWVEFSTWLFK